MIFFIVQSYLDLAEFELINLIKFQNKNAWFKIVFKRKSSRVKMSEVKILCNVATKLDLFQFDEK